MSDQSIFLVGTLGSHSRGKVIASFLTCTASNSLPDDFGLAMAFGTEFQDLSEEQQKEWVAWCEPAGSTLLLIPPFRIAEMKKPVRWRVYRPDRVEVGDEAKAVAKLAAEIKFEFDTDMQIAHDLGGLSVSGGVNTAFYRKHPHSGIFAVTGMPLWSLTTLDCKSTIADWIASLHRLSGKAQLLPEPTVEPSQFTPAADHFAVMLHVCERRDDSREELLRTLADSPVLSLPGDVAEACLADVEAAGLVSRCRLTKRGREVLLSSSYGVYVEAMEAMSQ